MNIYLLRVKNILFNLKNSIFGKYYRLVIWSERLKTDQVRLEILNINSKFECNTNITIAYYICNPNEEELLRYLDYLKNRYNICELIETNYKFEDSRILTKFIITKSDTLLFQDVADS